MEVEMDEERRRELECRLKELFEDDPELGEYMVECMREYLDTLDDVLQECGI